ncbi:MAG: flagellar biosynthesis protein FliQ [Clostridiales bacterium]|nr:flagellar biosynthesis protein FliQ [Clostridiales bacterium]
MSQALDVIQGGVMTVIKLSAPVLFVSMIIGLIISIFQAATQIHEQTITFVPKLIGILLVLIIVGSWMLENLQDYVRYIFDLIVKIS